MQDENEFQHLSSKCYYKIEIHFTSLHSDNFVMFSETNLGYLSQIALKHVITSIKNTRFFPEKLWPGAVLLNERFGGPG